MESKLSEKLQKGDFTTAVIGLGYVGLPVAVTCAQAGLKVIGVDINPDRIRQLEKGESYIQDVPSNIYKDVQHLITPTTDYSKLADADVINICVPTPLAKTKDPDISYIIAVGGELKKTLRSGQLIILESTTYPGTTDELVLPILEETGMQVGKDFFLAFSPERIDPGNEQYNVKNTPKVVGGITTACTEVATQFYKTFIDLPVPVTSTRVAEMVKLLENTFRMVNIGLVNELSVMCDLLGIDTYETIEAAATKPFGFLPFYPGPGLGGHCIPVDPYYLSWKLKTMNYNAQFIELAGKINFNMPHYVVQRVSDGLNERKKSLNGSRVLLLGVAYKEDIDDMRESPALDIIDLLERKGATVMYHDDYVPQLDIGEKTLRSEKLTDALVKDADCVVITTKHSGVDYGNIVDNANLLIDTRNATKGRTDDNIFKL